MIWINSIYYCIKLRLKPLYNEIKFTLCATIHIFVGALDINPQSIAI